MKGNDNMIRGNNDHVDGNQNTQIGDHSTIVGSNNYHEGNNREIYGNNHYVVSEHPEYETYKSSGNDNSWNWSGSGLTGYHLTSENQGQS